MLREVARVEAGIFIPMNHARFGRDAHRDTRGPGRRLNKGECGIPPTVLVEICAIECVVSMCTR